MIIILWIRRDKTVFTNYRRCMYEFDSANSETGHCVGMSEMRRKNRNGRESIPVEQHPVSAVRVRRETPGLPEMRSPDGGKSFMDFLRKDKEISIVFRILPENDSDMVL